MYTQTHVIETGMSSKFKNADVDLDLQYRTTAAIWLNQFEF